MVDIHTKNRFYEVGVSIICEVGGPSKPIYVCQELVAHCEDMFLLRGMREMGERERERERERVRD